jgi:molybdopterin-guanine dinucleotide biosynthesis protein A
MCGAEMIKAPGMLMVGAVDRNAGKTKFACSLINKFGSQCDITAIKVTTINKAGSSCPRGISNCNVCSSLEGNFYITEETNSQADKDTCRMFAAGADRVFWLRVLKKHLEEGIAALFDIIGNDAVSVCESNSLRQIVEPDLFLIVKNHRSKDSKASAKDVAKYADRIVLFDGNEFDVEAGEIELIDGRWACKMQATVIILAGGDSVRMGHDKSMLLFEGQPIIKHIVNQLHPHFNQILISADDISKYSFLCVEVIPDKVAGHGPLGGIASALQASANELNFVTACDIPQVDTGLMKMLLREGRHFDAVVPKTRPSQYEPLFAVYKKDVLSALEAALLSGNNRIIDALSPCRVRYVDLTDTQQLKNLNTMEDYLEFVSKKKDVTV